MNPAELDELINSCDKNKDGVIDYNEFIVMMTHDYWCEILWEYYVQTSAYNASISHGLKSRPSSASYFLRLVLFLKSVAFLYLLWTVWEVLLV